MSTYRLLSLLLVPLLFVTACGNDDLDCVGGDDVSLEEYITQENLTPTDGGNRLQYIIFDEGGADKPSATAQVTVTYVGYTTQGDTFDRNTNLPLQLPRLIEGWQRAIPLLGRGGRMQLFVPSELGYGSTLVGNICPDSDLIFDLTLVGFQ